MIKILSIHFYIFLLFSGCTFFNIKSYCQNVGYALQKQADVDAFKAESNNAREIFALNVIDKYSVEKIYNFDSLHLLQYIKWLDFRDVDSIKDATGLNNLKKVYNFIYTVSKELPPLKRLDSIENGLGIANIDRPDKLLRPTFISNIKYIGRSLSLSGNIMLNDVPGFAFDTSRFSLIFNSLNKKNFQSFKNKIFPRLQELRIRNCTNVDFSGFERMDTIRGLFLYRNRDSYFPFAPLEKYRYIYSVYYGDMGSGNNFEAGFLHIDSISRFVLEYNASPVNFKKMFPKPVTISEKIVLRKNPALYNLFEFADIKVPAVPLDSIILKDNLNLNNCNVPFICDALRLYPDRVFISGNGPDCSVEEIQKYCERSSYTTETNQAATLYPNPTYGYITWDIIEPEHTLRVYDVLGRTIWISTGQDKQINLSSLPAGIYYLKATDREGRLVGMSGKMIKI